MTTPTKNPAAVALGKLGGLAGGKARSEAKTKAAQANAKLGGRPRKQTTYIETENTFAGVVHVCAHRVNFWYGIEDWNLNDEQQQQLTDEAEERAKHCITEGYVSGELCCYINDLEIEFRGWWDIER